MRQFLPSQLQLAPSTQKTLQRGPVQLHFASLAQIVVQDSPEQVQSPPTPHCTEQFASLQLDVFPSSPVRCLITLQSVPVQLQESAPSIQSMEQFSPLQVQSEPSAQSILQDWLLQEHLLSRSHNRVHAGVSHEQSVPGSHEVVFAFTVVLSKESVGTSHACPPSTPQGALVLAFFEHELIAIENDAKAITITKYFFILMPPPNSLLKYKALRKFIIF